MVARRSSILDAFMPPDEINNPQINEYPETLSQNENDILFMQGISENNQTTTEAEIPECFRYHAFTRAFAGDPLIDKAHHEQKLACESENHPCIKMGAQPIKRCMQKIAHTW